MPCAAWPSRSPSSCPRSRPPPARPRLRAVRPLGVPFLVKVRLARRALEYRAVALDEEALVIEGQDPLPESRLVEATLMCAPAPFAVWTLPRGMEALADSYRVELKPYALNGLSQVLWAALAGPEA
jgi:hypothetical protein